MKILKSDVYPAFVAVRNYLSFSRVEKRIYISGLRDAALLADKKSGQTTFDKSRFTFMDTYVQLADEAAFHAIDGKTDEDMSAIAAATLIINEWPQAAPPPVKPTHTS